jgi:hypothetical protein
MKDPDKWRQKIGAGAFSRSGPTVVKQKPPPSMKSTGPGVGPYAAMGSEKLVQGTVDPGNSDGPIKR